MVNIRCKCSNPCSCYFEYDGDRPNSSNPMFNQYGRYSTRKKGSGTSADPYIIEFLDSEEFYVEAGQVHSIEGQLVSSTVDDAYKAYGISQIDYETPTEVFLGFERNIDIQQFFPPAHKFWFVSVQATFVANAVNSSGSRRLQIHWNHPPANTYGSFTKTLLAGTGSSGLPGTEDITLSCSALAPFASITNNPAINGPGGSFSIGIQQSSGALMEVRNIRFTMVAI